MSLSLILISNRLRKILFFLKILVHAGFTFWDQSQFFVGVKSCFEKESYSVM
jgi:hypothetical protein